MFSELLARLQCGNSRTRVDSKKETRIPFRRKLNDEDYRAPTERWQQVSPGLRGQQVSRLTNHGDGRRVYRAVGEQQR